MSNEPRCEVRLEAVRFFADRAACDVRRAGNDGPPEQRVADSLMSLAHSMLALLELNLMDEERNERMNAEMMAMVDEEVKNHAPLP